MSKSKTCAAPNCLAPRSESPRRYVHTGSRRLHTCRACYERWRAHGSFKRHESRWADDQRAIVAMRRKGKSIAEIVRAFPGLPRRTAYAICTRNGLAGVWGYEVGQGGRRNAG